RERLRGGGARRAAGSARRAGPSVLRVGHGRLGAALAGRGDLGRAQAGVSSAGTAPLVLASTSPQRRAILEQLGLPFELAVPGYEEDDDPVADPVALVR